MKTQKSKKYLWLATIVLCGVLLKSCGPNEGKAHWALPQAELGSLDIALRNAGSYTSEVNRHLDSLKMNLNEKGTSFNRRITLCQDISTLYMTRVADSALLYAYRARKLAEQVGDEAEYRRGSMLIVDALSAAGFFAMAVQRLDSINIEGASAADRVLYWQATRRLYSNMGNYTGDGTLISDIWTAKTREASDSLIALLQPADPRRRFLEGELLIDNGKVEKGRALLNPLLQTLAKNSNLYGMVAYQMGRTYRSTDQTRYAAYLAMAAQSDIMAGVRDGVALPSLGAWLYHQDDFSRAFQYINYAMTEAYAGNARMRLVYISRWVPEIDEAYRHDINKSRRQLGAIAILMTLLLIAGVVLLVFFAMEMKKRREAHSALANVSKMKDRYISDFIRLCSAYSEKYDSLCRTVSRKISAGQAQDLLKLVKYGKSSENENEEFYRSIDEVFLSLYPDFIDNINKLLRPEERFEISAESKTLTPELRIYGFIRLGVTESAKIARILNYSVNTVYSYRNRMRRRAINHETFDEEVLKIGLDSKENTD